MTVSIPGLGAPTGVANPSAPASLGVTAQQVTSPSGQVFQVQGDAERLFYEGQSQRYLTENRFSNSSDLMDLDRLLAFELLVYRATTWLALGSDYDGAMLTDRAETECRRQLKEYSALISTIKNDLGLTKSQRDKADYESVGAYLTKLKQRAKEFGIHREKQASNGITLCQQLFAIVGAYDRGDTVEREKLGFPDAEAVLDWIRDTMRPEFDKVDAAFRAGQQKYWIREI